MKIHRSALASDILELSWIDLLKLAAGKVLKVPGMEIKLQKRVDTI